MAARRPAVSSNLFWLASVMFFLSGGTGLAYQVIWFKRFAHVWGSSSLAFASVGASFLFGLGVGAYLIGRVTDRLERPIRWYGVAEIVIGVLALVIPFQIAWLISTSAGFYPNLPDNPVWRYLVQFAVTVLVVGPPTILMGGTLPLLIRQLTAHDGSLDQATGWLYAINTFGAAAGCYLTGFFFLPAAGLYWTNIACASLNIAIGVICVAASAKTALVKLPRPAVAVVQKEKNVRLTFSLVALYFAVALSGLGALMLEMTWSRQLAILLGGSTYAYSATLFVVLLGIALGSLLFHFVFRPFASSPWLPFTVITVLIVSCLAGYLFLPRLAVMIADQRAQRVSLIGNGYVCVSASMLLELIPAVSMGILFPLFVHLTRESAARVGRAVGDVYAWNTFGSIIGASLTAVLLFPLIGTAGAIALSVGVYVVALLLVLPWRNPLGLGLVLATLLIGGGVMAGVLRPQNPLYTNMGMYMYGNQSDRFFDLNTLYFEEGASCNVLVTQGGNKSVSLRVNGKVDASDGLDMLTQLGSAYFPHFFAPHARDVMVIGFGSGTTIGASLQFPGTQVTCCEIEPAVYYASEYFSHVNHAPHRLTREYLRRQKLDQLAPGEKLTPEDEAQIQSEARLQMVFGDGRSTLQGSSKKFDLIISEPSNPWLAGVSNLFTEEFFEAAHSHLNEGGVLAQWIQTYNFTWSDYLMIVRTLKTRFKHCGVLLLANGADTILLAADKPLLPTLEGLREFQAMIDASESISNDLKKWYGTTDMAMLLMKYYKADEELLLAAVERDPRDLTNNDMNLRLEYDAPLHLFVALPEETNAQSQILRVTSDGWLRKLGALVGVDTNGPEYHLALADQALAMRNDDQAVEIYQKVLDLDRENADAYIGIANIHKRRKRSEAAVALLQEFLKLKPDHVEVLRSLAAVHKDANDRAEAATVFKRIVEINPSDTLALMELGQLQQLSGLNEEALRTFLRLEELQPDSADVISAVANEQMLLKQYESAIKNFRRALQLRPVDRAAVRLAKNQLNPPVVWANNLSWLLATVPDARLRNGEEALYWAKAACEATGYKPEFIDTLAAAYAEVGNFDEAVRYCQQFLNQSQALNPELVQGVRDRLKLYQAGQPYRET